MDLIDTLVDLCFGHRSEMGVNGSSGRRGVTEIDLDDAQIDPCFQQVRGIPANRQCILDVEPPVHPRDLHTESPPVHP